ncbi:MAG: hypothetical protein SAL07_11345 [Oscillatoria sp. PMC 1051.18]|nr:hypothetical protein [Oscillatoria sp. PMC 1050.18]MEC5030501.1 hypothetical protein [Oscillatoria sp. PMC 1051.18]
MDWRLGIGEKSIESVFLQLDAIAIKGKIVVVRPSIRLHSPGEKGLSLARSQE